MTELPFDRYALNTLIIASGAVIGHVFSCTLVAYGFARLETPGKRPLIIILLATLMLPAPLIFLQDQSNYTLMLGLSFFRSSFEFNWAYLMAASLSVAAPVNMLFFFTQRAFVAGISVGGVKQ